MLKRIIITVLSFVLASHIMHGQIKIGDGIEIDKTVHNFGDILLDKGPVSCTFTIKNTSEKPIVIYNVTTTCGCTNVELSSIT